MRTTSQDGIIELVVQFTNGDGDPIDPDGAVLVSIFDPDFPPFDPLVTDGDATILDDTPVKVTGELGLYIYTYELAPDAKIGSWYDRWEATVDGVPLEMIFDFTVKEKFSMESVELNQNMIISVFLDESIANTDGETLGEDYEFLFSTVLNPMYASADLLSLEVGAFIPNLPVFTLDLAIHWASVQADAQTFPRAQIINPITYAPVTGTSNRNQNYFEVMRTEYVLCRAAFMAINNAIASAVKSKTLADLSVTYDVRIKEKLAELSDRCRELRRILNSNGTLSEGSSIRATSTIKGIADSERPTFGRDWLQLPNVRGGANTQTTSKRRAKRYWSD